MKFLTKMNRIELLEKIKKNKTKHEEAYRLARETFLEKYILKLEEYKAMVMDGKDPILYIGLKTPEHHTDDYNSVIEMLEMSTEEETSIDMETFECFVMDKWNWSHSFSDNTLSYLMK